ncbi:CARDB domain-containing protein [Stigmatella sp. ncwal1]|uniref:CARDB domain-containing protein n=1 Tax=Stigmatella ashevillensis TaxID=2995309 RepID=A0ABT5DGT5_9BACT|nr:CARDB domain-containing protein [Stigmatella ashevillena]MDC0712284.1 CARDB domain-containing protein [Stigmatella ashevillena]
MRIQKWWAGALASALVGCVVGPYPDDWDSGNGSGGSEVPSPWEPDPGATGVDFQVEFLSGPSALGVGSLVRARLCNRGTVSGTTQVAFVLSRDAVIDSRDAWLGSSESFLVQPGKCQEVSASVNVPDVAEGTYVLGAIADLEDRVRESNENNNFRSGSSIQVNRTGPSLPSLSWRAPKASDSLQVPHLVVQSAPGSTIRVYASQNCTGSEVASGEAGSGSSCEIPIYTPGYTSGGYSARSYNGAGNASGCASIPSYGGGGGGGGCGGSDGGSGGGGGGYGSNGYGDGGSDGGSGNCDNTPPAPPVIVEATWQYGSTRHELRVKGTAEPGSTVGLFIDVACTGTPAATATVGSNGTFNLVVLVDASSPGSLRRVFFAAKDAAENVSTCIEGPTYETPCAPGYGNCDGNPANGCETDLTSDVNHCGTCGTTCPGQATTVGVCMASQCSTSCAPGRYDCDGNAANGCESDCACAPTACTIDRQAELVITSLSVVEDPVRTAPGGAWHFGTLMKAMAGNQDPSTLVRQWLRTWNSAQTVNGMTLPARAQMQTLVLGPWEQRSGGASKPLDFNTAPFRLLAIVNRMDLREPGVQAGEGRFIFGVLDTQGKPLEFTLILEYTLPGSSPEAILAWARDWHTLGQLGLGSANYKAKLQQITDRFTLAGVMPTRPFGSAISQLRTNEAALSTLWEMREFSLTVQGLKPAGMALTPDFGFNNSASLGNFIRANEAAILAEQYQVPTVFSGSPFLAAAARVPDETFFWRAPSVSVEARHKFSLNTCSGCHSGETKTDFTHILPRAAGQASNLSLFMRGISVKDPLGNVTRTFNDMGRRAEDMAALVCGSGTALNASLTGVPPASNLPRSRVH